MAKKKAATRKAPKKNGKKTAERLREIGKKTQFKPGHPGGPGRPPNPLSPRAALRMWSNMDAPKPWKDAVSAVFPDLDVSELTGVQVAMFMLLNRAIVENDINAQRELLKQLDDLGAEKVNIGLDDAAERAAAEFTARVLEHRSKSEGGSK